MRRPASVRGSSQGGDERAANFTAPGRRCAEVFAGPPQQSPGGKYPLRTLNAAVGAGFYSLFVCECGQQKKQKRTKTKNEK